MARHCGYCYGRGHNKRTCPRQTDSYLTRYKASDPDTKEWYASRLLERGINPETGKPLTAKEKKAKTGYTKQERRCKYCDERGHNSRTCTAKTSDVKLINEVAKEFRIAAVERVKSEEFPKVGALLQYHHPREWMGSRDGYQPINEIHMVTGIEWDRVNFDRAFGGTTDWLAMVNLGAPGRPRHAGKQSHWRVDKVRRNNNGVTSGTGWSALSNPIEVTTPKPPPAWWCADDAGTEKCRFVQKGTGRNGHAMRIFSCALAAVKDGHNIDMANPRSWVNRLDELGLLD